MYSNDFRIGHLCVHDFRMIDTTCILSYQNYEVRLCNKMKDDFLRHYIIIYIADEIGKILTSNIIIDDLTP